MISAAPTTRPIRSAFFCDIAGNVDRVFTKDQQRKIAASSQLHPVLVTSENFPEQAAHLTDLEVIFSTWGMPELNEAQLDLLPNLKVVFYAAGSVQGFARPFLNRGIAVVSSWTANAIPVAEFTLAQIILANKGYFRNVREYRPGMREDEPFIGRGTFGGTIALLGAGQIGQKLIQLLQPFHLDVVVFDPFLSAAAAESLGVEQVSLEEAFARGIVVSNHLANLPATVGILTGVHFQSMQENATFINTGRAATVLESELFAVLQTRSDLTALLDVFDHFPLYDLPNVVISSHIAGSKGDELSRMADYAIEEYHSWSVGQPLRFAITLPMLDTTA